MHALYFKTFFSTFAALKSNMALVDLNNIIGPWLSNIMSNLPIF